MKILLICNAGASTSVVVQKMQEAAEAQGKEHEILALSAAEARTRAGDYDVLLLGPQLRGQTKTFARMFPEKPVDSIPPIYYGRLDGAAVLALAEGMYEND